jgi:hypothetical protein
MPSSAGEPGNPWPTTTMNKERAAADRELSALNSSGVGLRVRFVWRVDRFGHQIEAVDGPITRIILESIEGDQESHWPPSPPLQTVNISWIASDTQHGHVAMLMGAAGKNQWSMCVSVRDGDNDVIHETAGTELFFDVACRIHEEPEFLGSTYSTLQREIAVSDNLNCAFVPSEGPGVVVAPQDALIEAGGKRNQSPTLCCKVTDIRLTQLPSTLRWRYAVRRTAGGPLKFRMKKRS